MGKTFWLSIIVGIIIVLFAITLAMVLRENTQCQSNPFVFGAQRLADDGIQSLCQCTFTKYGITYPPIYFDDTGVIEMDTGTSEFDNESILIIENPDMFISEKEVE